MPLQGVVATPCGPFPGRLHKPCRGRQGGSASGAGSGSGRVSMGPTPAWWRARRYAIRR